MSKLSIVEAIAAHANKVKQVLTKKVDVDGGETKKCVTTFESDDREIQEGSEWKNVAVLETGETHASIMTKLSKMFFNIRLLKRLVDKKANVTNGTAGYLAKFKDATTIEKGVQLGSDQTLFLRNDGTWAKPPAGGGSGGATYVFTGDDNGFLVSENGSTPYKVSVTPKIDSNITGSGNAGYLAKFSSTNGLESGPRIGTGQTTFLRNDGEWAEPYDLATADKAGLLQALQNDVNYYLAGNGTWRQLQNNATTTSAGYALDARMAKTLNDKIPTSLATAEANGLLRKLPTSDTDAGAVRYLNGNGQWARLTRGSSSADGTPGLVPAPQAADYDNHSRRYLCEAGTWRVPPSVSADGPGYMTVAQMNKLEGIASGATVSGIPTDGITAGGTSVPNTPNADWTDGSPTVLTSYRAATAGTYLVMLTATVPIAVSTGSLSAVVNTNNTGMGSAPSVSAFGGNGTSVSSFYAYKITSPTMFYALAKQSSGAAQTVRWNFGVIRLA